MTYSYRAPDSGSTYDLAVRFTGVRKVAQGPVGPGDRFTRIERLKGLAADGRDVSLTARVHNVNDGDWRVVAEPAPDEQDLGRESGAFPRRVVETSTTHAQLAQGPGVRLWAWPVLVALGAVVAIVVQAVLANRSGLSVPSVLGLSLVGSLLGFVGGKLWYLALHRRRLGEFLQAGACIQGFLLVSLGVLAMGSFLLGLPVGTVLDVTAPGIFLGVAVGRPGCFFTGCCAGRASARRWGLVSSDRRLTIRRFPVQLLEAAAGLVIGLGTLSLLLLVELPVPGLLFIGALAAYTLVRQLLFPLRVESRTARGRVWTMLACGAVLIGAMAPLVV